MKNNINMFLGVLALSIMIVACTKKDDYKKYTEGGERHYPAKIDSLRIISGKYRIKVSGLFIVDPNIVKYRVFWNNGLDSVEVPVSRSNGVDSVNYIIGNLPEGPMTFELRTYDANGNKSVPMNIVGNVYGERYQASLINRGILSSELQNNNEAIINWENVDAARGMTSIEIKYTNSDNVVRDTAFAIEFEDQITVLKKFVAGNSLEYRTVYKPDTLSIDSFITNFQTASVKAEITSLYLSNYAVPFSRSAYDNNRWGDLADWTTNSAMKNHNGMGGYASDDGGVINIEAGWGSSAITNGKIHQTITLPAGRYSFTSELSDNNYDGDPPAYIVAAAGTEIPNIENLSSALGYTAVKNNKFEFELKQTTVVSLGMVLSFNTDHYMKIRSLRLYVL